MRTSNIGWLVVCVISLAAYFHRRAMTCDACAASASLLAPQSAMRPTILNCELIDAASRKPVTLASLKGRAKAIYIDVFASWCGPCQSFIPSVQALHLKLRDKGVLVLGLDVSDGWDAMQGDIRDQGITYPVFRDETGNLSRALGVGQIPTVIILDGQTLEQKARWVGGDNDSDRDRVLATLGVK
jgi:thiol-disulfide isomerase/thioredoxin